MVLNCDESTSTCDATASGGSGSGYSFTWTNLDEQYDSGGYSWGYVVWGLANQRYVDATDSNGATATASTIIYRPAGGGGGIQP